MKILFTATFKSSFVMNDLQILQKRYEVFSVTEPGILSFIKYLKYIFKVDATFSWFGSVYSSVLIFMTKIVKKKSVLVLGGVDVAKEKKINYGIWNSWWKSKLVKPAIINADVVLAVDNSIKLSAMRLCDYNGENIHVLPTGYDTEYWKPEGQKSNLVLTVAGCNDMKRLKVKGIDFLIEVAKEAREISFVVIGIDKKLSVELKFPENIKVIPYIQQSELLAYYRQAKVYFHPSYIEGLPNTLCEAMLCECFPVGTFAGGIPAAIGETGTLVNYGNTIETAEALRKGLQSGDGAAARQRVINFFSNEKRERELIKFISSLHYE